MLFITEWMNDWNQPSVRMRYYLIHDPKNCKLEIDDRLGWDWDRIGTG